MRKLISSIVLSLSVILAHGARANNMIEYFNAVTNSPLLADLLKDGGQKEWDLKSIILVKGYRCPGCYAFDLEMERPVISNRIEREKESRSYRFMTSLDLADETISVSLP